MIDGWRLMAALGCVAMGGLLAVELVSGGADPEDAVALPPAASAAALTPAAPVPPPVAPEAFSQRILARPLFTPNRQPPRKEDGSGRSGIASLRKRLTGVVIEPATREAVFAGEGRARGTLVREGDTIDGWTIETITREGVTVRSADGVENLPLPARKDSASGAKPSLSSASLRP